MCRQLCSKTFWWALGISFRRACFHFCNHSQGYFLSFLRVFHVLHPYRPQSWTRSSGSAIRMLSVDRGNTTALLLLDLYNGLISHFIHFYFTSLTFELSEKLKINNLCLLLRHQLKKNYYIRACFISSSGQPKMFKENL